MTNLKEKAQALIDNVKAENKNLTIAEYVQAEQVKELFSEIDQAYNEYMQIGGDFNDIEQAFLISKYIYCVDGAREKYIALIDKQREYQAADQATEDAKYQAQRQAEKEKQAEQNKKLQDAYYTSLDKLRNGTTNYCTLNNYNIKITYNDGEFKIKRSNKILYKSNRKDNICKYIMNM